MTKIDSANACPKCGAPVPSEAPQGLCPQCVLAQAVAPEPAPTATAHIPSLERLAVAFPQLQVIELIGRGGMGFVFKARQPHLDRFVALKLLPDSLAHDPHFAERFNREGRTLARLNHPNIVSIFDFGQAGGFYFLLMEYVDGVNLRQAMQAGRFSPSEALAIVPKICEALQYAHEEGVLHRDIKPENILLDAKGRVKIADFGIAKIVGEDMPEVSLTATGAALGTPHYMAPEQFEKPGTVDHRADIYSLGVVFYEMLTGELPIGRFSPPSQRTPVDPRVDDVVMRTLEKEREKRFQSAGEMQTNVEHLTEVGAGSFKGGAVPPKVGASEAGPRGTMVIDPSAVQPAVRAWSLKSIWGAVLVGISLVPMIAFLALITYLALSRRGFIGGWEVLAASLLSLPAIAGTILGWMALNDIRVKRLRGLPLAVFAALAWPLMLLVGGTLVIPAMISFRPSASATTTHFSAMLMLLVPAGIITFAIWAVYSAARWGANKPASQRRGVLKWVFLALLIFAAGIVITTRFRGVRTEATVLAPALSAETNAMPWIRFTFTAVELLEAKGVRWLAIDYLDDVHGECQKAFPWETTIPAFKAQTRTTEFFKESEDSKAKLARLRGDLLTAEAQLAEYRLVVNGPDRARVSALESRIGILSNQIASVRNEISSLPEVRHQRIEYRMPDSVSREQLEKFRDDVAKALNQKTFRLELGEEKLLFELFPPAGGSLRARAKAVEPYKFSEPAAREYKRLSAELEVLANREGALLEKYTSNNPIVLRTREQIEALQKQKERLETRQ